MKKEGQKSLTLSVWRKPLNIWPRKWPKRKNLERRDRERNWRDRQKAFEKVKFDSYLFLKIKIQSVERNRARIEFHLKTGLTLKEIGKESKEPETLN